ncbi:hypothetical protein A45J_0241 [hot springs metagenome]|uniref:Uncharacterized protein n=1 Tax=hot springs metagenome TaxID=433727 RepID=A0A5J4KX30_9ZZZZ
MSVLKGPAHEPFLSVSPGSLPFLLLIRIQGTKSVAKK